MNEPDDTIFDKRHRIKSKVVIESEMFYSEPFRELSASALRTLLRCLQKRKWDRKRKQYTDAGFIFPYAEAKWLGIKTTVFWTNMKTLLELGFIDIVHQGGSYQKYGVEKDYSIYKMSDRWRLYGRPEFKKVEKAQVLKPDFFVRKNLEKKSLRASSGSRSCPLQKVEVGADKTTIARLQKVEVDKETGKVRRSLKTRRARGRLS